MTPGKLSSDYCLTCGRAIRLINGLVFHVSPDPTHRARPAVPDTAQKRQALVEKVKSLPDDMQERIRETGRRLRRAAGTEKRISKLKGISDSEWKAAEGADT